MLCNFVQFEQVLFRDKASHQLDLLLVLMALHADLFQACFLAASCLAAL